MKDQLEQMLQPQLSVAVNDRVKQETFLHRWGSLIQTMLQAFPVRWKLLLVMGVFERKKSNDEKILVRRHLFLCRR